MSKRTPGPWVIKTEGDPYGDPSIKQVALYGHRRWVRAIGQPLVPELIAVLECEEGHPDARLLGAALELYEALEDLVRRCDGDEGVRADGSNIQTIAAHAALAKAREE